MTNRQKIIRRIIQDYQNRIDALESELQSAKKLNLALPEISKIVLKELAFLYDKKTDYEIQEEALRLIKDGDLHE